MGGFFFGFVVNFACSIPHQFSDAEHDSVPWSGHIGLMQASLFFVFRILVWPPRTTARQTILLSGMLVWSHRAAPNTLFWFCGLLVRPPWAAAQGYCQACLFERPWPGCNGFVSKPLARGTYNHTEWREAMPGIVSGLQHIGGRCF